MRKNSKMEDDTPMDETVLCTDPSLLYETLQRVCEG